MKTKNKSGYGEIRKFKFSIIREKTYPYENEDQIQNNHSVAVFLEKVMGETCLEYVMVLAIDNANKIIGTQIVEGTTNQCAVYIENIFRFLLLSGASGFIIAHNHPGGNRNPSEADWMITEKITKAGSLFNLSFLDHIILSNGEPISMRGMSRWK